MMMQHHKEERSESCDFIEKSNSQKSCSSSSKSLNSNCNNSSGYEQPSTSGCSSDIPAETKLKDMKKKKVKRYLNEMKSLVPLEQLRGSKTKTMQALSHALWCIKRMKRSVDKPDQEFSKNKLPTSILAFNRLDDCFSFKIEEGFIVVIAVNGGIILHITGSVTEALGVSKDMLLGKCFEDFICPKDRVCFITQLALSFNFYHSNESKDEIDNNDNNFHIRLRSQEEVKNNSITSKKEDKYKVFEIFMNITEPTNSELLHTEDDGENNYNACAVLKALPVHSAYKSSEETPAEALFTTRHTASCLFSHIDSTAIPYIGYLPHDIMGKSIFDHYHPEDLPVLKETYEQIIYEHGHPFLGKPYRFRVQNGCYVLLETEWSSFVNPWLKKIEFVIGQHRILKGPLIPDIFSEEENAIKMPEKILKDSCERQNEIKQLLSETIKRHLNGSCKLPKLKRQKDLVKNLENQALDDVMMNNTDYVEPKRTSCSEASIAVGEISLHHQDSYTNLSSTPPPSYNHINYAENIHRYFNSQPKTLSSGESMERINDDIMTFEDPEDPMPDISPDHKQNNSNELPSSGNIPHDSYCHITLTEEILSRHNEMTKKIFLQQHQEKSGKHSSCSERDSGNFGNKLLACIKKNLHCPKYMRSQSSNAEPANKYTAETSKGFDGINSSNSRANIDSKSFASVSTPAASKTFTTIDSPKCKSPRKNPHCSRRLISPKHNNISPVTLAQSMTNLVLPTYALIPHSSSSDSYTHDECVHISESTLLPVTLNTFTTNPGVICHPPSTKLQASAITPMILVGTPVYQPTILTPFTNYVQTTVSGKCCDVTTVKESSVTSTHQNVTNCLKNVQQNKPCCDSDRKCGATATIQLQSEKSIPKQPAYSKLTPVNCNMPLTRCETKECEEGGNLSNPDFQDELTGSSLYSFLKSEKSTDSDKTFSQKHSISVEEKEIDCGHSWDIQTTNKRRKITTPLLQVYKQPPWMENVNVTPNLVYQYQLPKRELTDLLHKDLEKLKNMKQPKMVNEQLQMLYQEQEKREQKQDFFGFIDDMEKENEGYSGFQFCSGSRNEPMMTNGNLPEGNANQAT